MPQGPCICPAQDKEGRLHMIKEIAETDGERGPVLEVSVYFPWSWLSYWSLWHYTLLGTLESIVTKASEDGQSLGCPGNGRSEGANGNVWEIEEGWEIHKGNRYGETDVASPWGPPELGQSFLGSGPATFQRELLARLKPTLLACQVSWIGSSRVLGAISGGMLGWEEEKWCWQAR